MTAGHASTLHGVLILLGLGLFSGSFYLFTDTFKRSAQFHPDTGALRVVLSCAGILCGGLIAAFTVIDLLSQGKGG